MQHKGEFGHVDGEHRQKSMTVRAITKGGHLNVKQHPDQIQSRNYFTESKN